MEMAKLCLRMTSGKQPTIIALTWAPKGKRKRGQPRVAW